MNVLIFILELIGGYLYLQRGGLNFIQFFTEDSNTYAMIACLILAIEEYRLLKNEIPSLPHWTALLKFIAAVCLTLTFLVVIFVLIPIQGGKDGVYFFLINGSMLYHHLLCPILVFVSFLWIDPLEPVTMKDVRLSLVPTLIYAGILILLNLAKVVDGPYPFLRVYQQPVYMSLLWVMVILGGAYAIAWLLQFFVKLKTDSAICRKK